MTQDFKRCLDQGKIAKSTRVARLAGKELKAAASDLADAEDSFKDGKYKWAIIQAYYSFFHAARSLLYCGYKERSHYCLAVALEALFVTENKLSRKLVSNFQKAMYLREEADYELDFSRQRAEWLIKHAKEFLGATRKILD